ncbi:hypothetical protein ACEPPN_015260 [Leptodophora sp. 'Broadleaf-Isolate-01']
MQKDAVKLLSSLKKTPKKSKKPKGPVVSKKKSVTFRKTHMEEEEVVEEEEESEIEVSPLYKVSLITIAYVNDVDFFNYTYLLDLNSPECLTWAQFNTNITDAEEFLQVVRHNGNKSLTIKAFYTTVGPQPIKALVAQGPRGPAKVGRPKKKSAEPIVSRPYDQTSEDEAKQAFLNNPRLLTAPRQPRDGRGNSTTDDLIRSLNRQKEAEAGGIIALNRQLADQYVCSSESCPNYRKSCFKATPDSPHIFITRPDREMWAKQVYHSLATNIYPPHELREIWKDRRLEERAFKATKAQKDEEKARAKVEKERETTALSASMAQPIMQASLTQPLSYKSRYEEEELPQRRGGSKGTSFLDMTSVRNSSPLRDDIAINTQLEAFGAYLAVHLPPNRQARAPAVVATFMAKEYSLDDLRTLTPSDEVPAGLLQEIKKLISPFNRGFKQILAESAAKARVEADLLLGLQKSQATEEIEGGIDSEEDLNDIREDSMLKGCINSQDKFDNKEDE